MTMKCDIKSVLIVEPVGQKCVDILTAHGIEVTLKFGLSEKDLIKNIIERKGRYFDAIIVQSTTKITVDILHAAKNLKVVACAGAYFKNVDLFAVKNRKIVVINAPRSNVLGACEFTCTLIMALARNLAKAPLYYCAGILNSPLYSGTELSGRTLALVGLCDIAKEVACRMKAFGMKVIAFDPSMRRAEFNKLGVIKTTLSNMWPRADYIVLYTTPFGYVRTFITADVIRSCKVGVKIIVVGHGGVFEPNDIYDGLRTGRIGGAALDLYQEFVNKDLIKYSIFTHPAVIGTTHRGTQTADALERSGQEIAEQIVNLCKPGTYSTPLSIVTGLRGE